MSSTSTAVRWLADGHATPESDSKPPLGRLMTPRVQLSEAARSAARTIPVPSGTSIL
jgi:hypothetical protein